MTPATITANNTGTGNCLFENREVSLYHSHKKDLYLLCIKSYRLANKVNRLLTYYKEACGSLTQINKDEEALFLVSRSELTDRVFPTLKLRIILS